MIPGIPAQSWSAIQRAKAMGLEVKVRQFAAQWVVVIDGEVAHANDALKLLQSARRRRELDPVAP